MTHRPPVVAIVVITVVTVLSIVLLNVIRKEDSTALTVQIIGFVTVATTAFLSYLKSSENAEELYKAQLKIDEAKTAALITAAKVDVTDKKITTLAVNVDGRLSRLLAVTEKAAHAQGVLVGEQTGHDRAVATQHELLTAQEALATQQVPPVDVPMTGTPTGTAVVVDEHGKPISIEGTVTIDGSITIDPPMQVTQKKALEGNGE